MFLLIYDQDTTLTLQR